MADIIGESRHRTGEEGAAQIWFPPWSRRAFRTRQLGRGKVEVGVLSVNPKAARTQPAASVNFSDAVDTTYTCMLLRCTLGSVRDFSRIRGERGVVGLQPERISLANMDSPRESVRSG